MLTVADIESTFINVQEDTVVSCLTMSQYVGQIAEITLIAHGPA